MTTKVDDATRNMLIEKAWEARKNSYSPYSGFAVGAALLCEDGTVYKGCNIENIAFGPTICAERTAFVKAVSEGHRDFVAIGIVGNFSDEARLVPGLFASPCGVCRQVMAEFCDPETFEVLLGNEKGDIRPYLLKEMLPVAFAPER